MSRPGLRLKVAAGDGCCSTAGGRKYCKRRGAEDRVSVPGERSACYSADLLLRQYKRAREELGATFSYKNIKKVYTNRLV